MPWDARRGGCEQSGVPGVGTGLPCPSYLKWPALTDFPGRAAARSGAENPDPSPCRAQDGRPALHGAGGQGHQRACSASGSSSASTPAGLHFVFHLARAGWVRFTEIPHRTPLRPGRATSLPRLHSPGGSGTDGHGPDRGGHQEEPGGLRGPDPRDVPGIAASDPIRCPPLRASETFAGILGASSQQIKGVLRSQGIIAGIGNAYSDEILHAAKISPFAIAKSLDRDRSGSSTTPSIPCWEQRWRKPGASRPTNSRTRSGAHMRVHGRTGEAVPGLRGHGPGSFLCRYRTAVLPDVPDQRQDPGRPQDVALPEVAPPRTFRNPRTDVVRETENPAIPSSGMAGFQLLVGLTGFEPATP